MDWDRQNAITDLRWYFVESAGACGLRSCQGGIQDVLAMGTLIDRRIRLSDETLTDSQMTAYARARAIHERIIALALHYRHVLDLAFGSAHTLDDVSLALCADQTSAREAHAVAMRKARLAQDIRPKRIPVGVVAAKRSRPNFTDGLTVSQWLCWLAQHDSKAGNVLLDRIRTEAKQELENALGAYIVAWRQVA
jgi:hypothetical protein